MAACQPVQLVVEHGRHPAAWRLARAVGHPDHKLGAGQRGLDGAADGCRGAERGGLPGTDRRRRVLGGDRRQVSLYPIRPLSVRSAMAARRRPAALPRPLRGIGVAAALAQGADRDLGGDTRGDRRADVGRDRSGLPYEPTDSWGGLPITLILSTFGLAFSFPLAVLVALGRRSKLPAIKALCVRLRRADPGCAADHRAVHGKRDVSLVHAGRPEPGQAAARAGRDHPFRGRLRGRGDPRWIAGAAARPIRGGRRARPGLLGEDGPHHPAAGAAARDPTARQYVHRPVQGHEPSPHHRDLRPPGRRPRSRSTTRIGKPTASRSI